MWDIPLHTEGTLPYIPAEERDNAVEMGLVDSLSLDFLTSKQSFCSDEIVSFVMGGEQTDTGLNSVDKTVAICHRKALLLPLGCLCFQVISKFVSQK